MAIDGTHHFTVIHGTKHRAVPRDVVCRALQCLSRTSLADLTGHAVERLKALAETLALGSSDPRQKEIKCLSARMEQATSLVEYEECTTTLDRLQGHESWKEAIESVEPGYRPDFIREELDILVEAFHTGDPAVMLNVLRTHLSRDLGGMNMLSLYKHSWFGTKKLIDEYNQTVVATIEKLVRTVNEFDMTHTDIKLYQDTLKYTGYFFGSSALILSGGARLGMKHIGVVKTLWEAGLLPKVICGASAGSIVAAITGISTDQELGAVLDHFLESADADLAVFDPAHTSRGGWFRARCRTWWTSGTFFEMHHLETVMKRLIKDMTFQEAYNKTRRILNITVSTQESSEAVILNFQTAPDVLIWSAVCASCSVPVFYKAANLHTKGSKTDPFPFESPALYVDGSLDHDIPTQKLSQMFNVNFFIVSQVNPHVRLFLEPEETFTGVQPTHPARRKGWISRLLDFARAESVHRAQELEDLGLPAFIWRYASILSQQYTGDVNIYPDIAAEDFGTMLANPDSKLLQRSTVQGEKATWPKMCRIQNSVTIELALVEAMNELRDREHFGTEARKARQEAEEARLARCGGRRPNFLRRPSLDESSSKIMTIPRTSGPPTPLPANGLRKTNSASDLKERLFALTPADGPKALAPQAGLDADATPRHIPLRDFPIPSRVPSTLGRRSSAMPTGPRAS